MLLINSHPQNLNFHTAVSPFKGRNERIVYIAERPRAQEPVVSPASLDSGKLSRYRYLLDLNTRPHT